MLAELVAELADEFASFGSWDIAPGAECLYALVDFVFDAGGGIEGEGSELGAIDRGGDNEFVPDVIFEVGDEPGEEFLGIHGLIMVCQLGSASV